MFKTSIASTPLTSDAADAYFHNIYGDNFGSDNSFVATLRALVAPRMKEDEHIYLMFGQSNFDTTSLSSAPTERVVQAICRNYELNDTHGAIIIHSFTSSEENNLANFRAIGAKFTSCYDGYHCLDKVKAFYHKSFIVDCYINPEHKNVIVFVDNLDTKKLHYLQVSILAFLPWYFDPEAGVSELEMELLYSLRETTSEKYESCIAKIAEAYDFKSARVRQLLAGFETRYERMECDKVRREIQQFDNEMNRLNEQIGVLLGRRNDTCIKLMGLERKIAEGGEDSEIMEYFLCNNRLYLENVTDQDMYFAVKDYLMYFDREMAERAISNTRSFVYPYGNNTHNGITKDGMKKLMTEIFVSEEPRLRIKFCAAYRFALNGSVSTQGSHCFPSEFSDCMPNTHIDRYNCMGNYPMTINKLLANHDYIGALEQCVASCKSLNWGDSTVMSAFMENMWGSGRTNNRCIELPDGRVVKPVEAIKWLEEQEAISNVKEKEEE